MNDINFRLVLVHTAILWGATFIVGFIYGVAVSVRGGQPSQEVIGIANTTVILTTMVIISLFSRTSWRHFILIFLALTAVSLLNLLIFPVPLATLLIGCLMISVAGAIGKLIGDLLARLRRRG